MDLPGGALPRYDFDSREIQLAKHVAAARALSYADSEGQVTHGDQDALDAHLTGVLGEMAVRRALGLPNEEVIYVFGDGGSDLTIEGYSADVKTTAADVWRPDLVVSADKPLRADLYVLAHRFAPQSIRIIGYATQEVVKHRKPERFPGDRLNYVVGPDELRVLP